MENWCEFENAQIWLMIVVLACGKSGSLLQMLLYLYTSMVDTGKL